MRTSLQLCWALFLGHCMVSYVRGFQRFIFGGHACSNVAVQTRSVANFQLSAKKRKARKTSSGELEDLLMAIADQAESTLNLSHIGPISDSDQLIFPELEKAGIDEKKLRTSPFGKVLFGILDRLFPIFKEPNWFDVYDPPLSAEQNLDLPYFDGYDFVNSSWTIYVRHRYGAWNWLDRLGLVPQSTQRVFLRGDGKTMWSDGFYGEWFINPAINYFQLEKHFGRGYGYSGYHRGIRIFQVQRWNFEHEIGRYWNRGLRSYLRNETNFYAIEGRIWGAAAKWRPYPRDQGKFIAIRDGTNLTEVFGGIHDTPWERRFNHALTLPFYQAHPDQLERIEDNFDMFYTNLGGREIR
jgi:hypothetical protein